MMKPLSCQYPLLVLWISVMSLGTIRGCFSVWKPKPSTAPPLVTSRRMPSAPTGPVSN